MRRVFNGLATAAFVLALAVSPLSAAPKREASPTQPSPIKAVIAAIRKLLVCRPLDDMTWPRP
jgi:hypothetical protein